MHCRYLNSEGDGGTLKTNAKRGSKPVPQTASSSANVCRNLVQPRRQQCDASWDSCGDFNGSPRGQEDLPKRRGFLPTKRRLDRTVPDPRATKCEETNVQVSVECWSLVRFGDWRFFAVSEAWVSQTTSRKAAHHGATPYSWGSADCFFWRTVVQPSASNDENTSNVAPAVAIAWKLAPASGLGTFFTLGEEEFLRRMVVSPRWPIEVFFYRSPLFVRR